MSRPDDGGFVDTHAHLDDPAFDPDRTEVIAAAHAAGVERIVNVGYAPERWRSTVSLAGRHPSIAAILGLHPVEAERFDDALVEELAATLVAAGAKAVGEIGFDLVRPASDVVAQRNAFVAQIGLASRLALPIVIHQRAAEDELIEVLRAAPDLPAVVLHSFDGSKELARFAVDRGYVVGIGGLATKATRRDLRNVLAAVPLEALVLETDSPYLIPAGLKARRNEPASIVQIARRLAPLWRVSADELASTTTRTAFRTFGLSDRCPASSEPPL